MPQPSTIFPPETRLMFIPAVVACFPVAGIPISSPSCVPVAVQRVTTVSPSAIWSSIVIRRSGNALRYITTNSRNPSGPRICSGAPMTVVTKSSAISSSITSRWPLVQISSLTRRTIALFSSVDMGGSFPSVMCFPASLLPHRLPRRAGSTRGHTRPSRSGAAFSLCSVVRGSGVRNRPEGRRGRGFVVDLRHHVLDVRVVLEAVRAQVLAVARLLEAAVRHLAHQRDVVVDPHRPELELARRVQRAADVACPHARG